MLVVNMQYDVGDPVGSLIKTLNVDILKKDLNLLKQINGESNVFLENK
ncbi:MAG: hypothetical protein ACRC41_08340 [Sarcina sp.]